MATAPGSSAAGPRGEKRSTSTPCGPQTTFAIGGTPCRRQAASIAALSFSPISTTRLTLRHSRAS
jgi:hypothetical protein